jgi:hypothetical protein
MTPRISIDDLTLQKLQKTGELRVEDPHGVPVILMTVDARQQLVEKLDYDDNELAEEDMLATAAEQLADPEGWGAPEMDVYDQLYGDKPTDHAKDQ